MDIFIRFFWSRRRKMSYIFFGAPFAPRVATSALAKIKVGRFVRPTFILEQATRVELAGSSLGSCRHTARRRLLFFRIVIIFFFLAFVNDFFGRFIKKTELFARLFNSFLPFDNLCIFRKILSRIPLPKNRPSPPLCFPLSAW